jgi:hypothetical protein
VERLLTEYVCLTLLAEPGEAEPAFKARLTAFWTHVLRTAPDDYERVYAEATRFAATGGRVSRQYMVECDAADAVAALATTSGVACAPVDPDDTYTKYEAASPDWFQLDH